MTSRPPSDADDHIDVGEKTVELRKVTSVQPVVLGAGALLAARYQIEATIGDGGSGQVFRAWDRVLGEPVALKILRADRAREKSWIKRLAREVKVARAIRHPNVCRVFDLGFSDGHWFVSMELAAGGSLREALRAGGARPLAARLADARAICAGLAAIHAVGITHRDVTPHNVLRMADGRLVLSDFGLASDGTDTTMHGGTPNYMPPETAMGERADQRSDVWQLGFILHEVMFGRRPEWDTREPAMTLRSPLAPDASPVEEELARLCADCLAHNPAARPLTAVAVAGRLAAAETARSRGGVQRMLGRVRGLRRRQPRLVAAAAIGVCVVLTTAITAAVTRRAFRAPALAAPATRALWDDETRAAVRRAFIDSGDPNAAAAFDQVDARFKQYLPRAR
jgi:serine/threonine-protein kinase